MMYSPAAIMLERRPRPPGSLPHRTAQLYAHNRAHRDSTDSTSTSLGSLDSPNKVSREECNHGLDETPTDLREEDEVSIELQGISAPERATGIVELGSPSSRSLKHFTSPGSIIKSGVAEGIAQPSPPPPYGPDSAALSSHVAVVSTPPTQDIDIEPLRAVNDEDEEEMLRRNRATEAAKALGLAMQSSPSMSTDGSIQEGMDLEEIKMQLRQMRRRLRTRDRELVMAAQVAQNVLRQHEELVSALPDHVKSILPQLLDPTSDHKSHYKPSLLDSALTFAFHGHSQSYQIHSPSPFPSSSQSRISATSPFANSTEHSRKLFRTVRDDDISRPFPLHKHPRHARNVFNTPTSSRTRSTTYTETQQQESDDKLLLLERALSEARENEETQRKMVTKLKRDFERLQREFDHVEMIAQRTESEYRPTGAGASAESSSSTESMTSSQFDSWAWKQTQDVVTEEVKPGGHAMLKPRNTKVKLRIKPKTRVSIEREAEAEMRRQANDDELGWGLTRFPEFPGDRLTRLPPRPTFNRLKAKLRHTSPKKVALSPRHTPHRVQHQKMASTSTVSDQELINVSPSKAIYTRTDITPRSIRKINQHNDSSRSMLTERDSLRSRASPHVRYESLDSHASMTHSAHDSIRSIGFVGSRSLGSELGSEYGDEGPRNNRDAGKWEDENSGDDSTGTELGRYSQPFAIPANASSGLSSLAMALAPNSPISTKKSRQVTPKRKRTPKRVSPAGLEEDGFDTGSFRPKKGRKNWIRPLQLSVARGLDSNTNVVQQRPMMFPRTSSDGTIALAHRRLRLNDMREESMDGQIRRNRPEMELYSIPARLINDVIVLFSILLEWIEMIIVIVWRVFVAVRYGRESIFRTWRQGRSRRYYI